MDITKEQAQGLKAKFIEEREKLKEVEWMNEALLKAVDDRLKKWK